ncbi:MAG: hypothetical protein RLZZ77_450 [Bacteroidota bacterium]|jgi:hypothetical protein
MVVMCLICAQAYTQSASSPFAQSRKGQFYIYWGYNRAYYDESDLHFKGDGYDFTLYNAKAEDMPERFTWKGYFNPTRLSIPQFNFHLGYFINENTAISIGTDHMKYHLIQTQDVIIDGHIDESYAPDSATAAEYTGEFDMERMLYTAKFMNFHHSNGFNFVRASIEKRANIWGSKNGQHLLNVTGAASVGVMLPWTDFTFFGKNYPNWLHVAGYGFSAQSGFRYEFKKHFFVQVQGQIGWSNLPDILLEDEKPSRADQKIVFFQRSWAVGTYFGMPRRAKKVEDK